MKAFYENSFTMLRVVSDYLFGYTTVWTTSVPFTAAYNALKGVISEIQALIQIIEIDRLGLAKAKEQKRNIIVEMGIFLRNAVIPYANSIHDVELKSFFNFSESEFKKLRDTIIVEKLKGFHDKAVSLGVVLAPYGIDVAWLASFSTFLADYDGYIPKPRLGIAERKTANAMVITKIREAKEILKGQLDYLVGNYATVNPTFVEGYTNARIIIDLAGGTSETVEGSLAQLETKVLFVDVENGDKFKFENKGPTTLLFSRKADGSGGDDGLKVETGTTVTKNAEDLAGSGEYLNVTNQDPTNEGSFRVTRE